MTTTNARATAPHGYHTALHRQLVDIASAPYRQAGRFAHGFARGKLWTDPLFIDLLRFGLLPAKGQFLDLGCGQAVFASWLLAAQQLAEAGQWHKDWPAAPRVEHLVGYELMPSDVARGRQALAAWPQIDIRQANVITEPFPQSDAVTILDVLHYFDENAQAAVLRKVRECLSPGGVLVIRVGDAGRGWRFELSRRVDQAVTWVRGHGWSDLHCRPINAWVAALEQVGFSAEVIQSVGGPPFANTFVVGRLPVTGTIAA
jgi:SAM-dependent methyltransferase